MPHRKTWIFSGRDGIGKWTEVAFEDHYRQTAERRHDDRAPNAAEAAHQKHERPLVWGWVGLEALVLQRIHASAPTGFSKSSMAKPKFHSLFAEEIQ
jgi:hypothetical protein